MIEAMKMENIVVAAHDGVVERIVARAGDSVAVDEVILEFAASADDAMSTTGERPFRVIGVQQIALGAPDKADLRALWVDASGSRSIGLFRRERENVDEDICAVGTGLARVEVDLMSRSMPAPSRRSTCRRSTTSVSGSTTCAARSPGSRRTASAWRPAASARARRVTTSASSIRARTTRSRSPAPAC